MSGDRARGRALISLSLMTRHELHTDFVVVGGGLAGACAAIAAARNGAKVVLVQDRSVLGGNASSEVRMHVVGADVPVHPVLCVADDGPSADGVTTRGVAVVRPAELERLLLRSGDAGIDVPGVRQRLAVVFRVV